MVVSFYDYVGTVIPPKWKPSYLGGQMIKVITFLGNCGVNSNDYIKSGSTCIVWNYVNQGVPLVIKLCTKRIEYFKSFPNVTVTAFKRLICEQFKSLLLPIRDILYEDQNYFIYTQEKITILDLPEINIHVFTKILDVVKMMFTTNVLTCDLISSNFGWGTDRQLYLLDYHDMKPVSDFFKKSKWSKIVRCLLEYTSYLLFKKGFEVYTGDSFIDWKSEMVIVQKKFGADYFPQHFVDLFKSFASNDAKYIINKITDCQSVINGGVSQYTNNPVIIIPSASNHIHNDHTHKHKSDKKKRHEEKKKKHDKEDDKHKHKHKHKH